MTAPSIFEQTGWKGSTPQAICQDFSVLVAVKEYDYDLTDKRFVILCKRRGSWNKVPFEGHMFEYFRDTKLQELDFLLEVDAMESERGYKYNDHERKTMWSIILAGRGAMQDCWELYIGRR